MAQYVPPASIHTLTHTAPGLVIHYPQVYGLMNPGAEEAINRAIILQIQDMQREQQQVQNGTNPQTTGTFEIKTNERGILSLVLTNYTYSEHKKTNPIPWYLTPEFRVCLLLSYNPAAPVTP
ncbi:PdaC/SigV domain-containing protein [Paenibacillus lautus]|uniref:PdaC/SigV domain-containing protein n=1 Tax=Paenibacillus lautus TaxID=1401 RepID=UPI003D2C8D2F